MTTSGVSDLFCHLVLRARREASRCAPFFQFGIRQRVEPLRSTVHTTTKTQGNFSHAVVSGVVEQNEQEKRARLSSQTSRLVPSLHHDRSPAYVT